MTTSTATPGLTTPRTHLDAFSAAEKTLPGHDRPAIARQRRAAIARFGELGFPNERNEDWKFTNLAPLVRTPMQVDRLSLSSFAATLGDLPAGVLFTSLPGALEEHPELVEPYLGRYANYEDHPFVALNTALTQDGVLVLTAQRFREQERNRADARARLTALIVAAAVAPIKRRASKPTAGSQERRLSGKTVRAKVKATRGRINADD